MRKGEKRRDALHTSLYVESRARESGTRQRFVAAEIQATLSRFRLTNAGDLSAVFAKGELLQQIGNVFAGRYESHLDPPVRPDRCDATDETQRIGDTFPQVDLEHPLTTEIGEWRRRLEDAAERVEADRDRFRARMARREELPDHVEQ